MKDQNKIYLKDLDISTNEKLVQFLLEAPVIIVFSPEEEELAKNYKFRTSHYAYPIFAEKGLFKLHRSENNLIIPGRREYISKYTFESFISENSIIVGSFTANKIYGIDID